MRTKTELYRVPGKMIAYLELNSIDQIIKDKGLDARGDVQRFHTANALRRITKYMPYRTGMTIKVTVTQTNVNIPQIITDTPYAKYLFYGKVMVGPSPKVATDKDLHFTTTFNALAGPHWDRRLMAAERDIMAQEATDYVKRRR